MSLVVCSPKWLRNCATLLNSFTCYLLFLLFDLVDTVFCFIYRYLDVLFDGEVSPCGCSKLETQKEDDEDYGISESLYARKNMFREIGFLQFGRKRDDSIGRTRTRKVNSWSDCGCESCLSWVNHGGDYKLHFSVKEPLMGMLTLLSFHVFGLLPLMKHSHRHKYHTRHSHRYIDNPDNLGKKK